jgi:hypothetical protein
MVQIDRELLDQLEQEMRTAGAAENAGSAAPTVVWRSQRENTSEDPKLVVIVTCDEKYFLKYGKAFIRSFAANAGNNCALHLHVLDPSQHFVLEQSSLLHQLARRSVTVSFESTGGIAEEYGDDFRWRKVWYTCARFIHLPAWLRSFGRPIILVDIDAIIERPMDELLTALQNAPMGMYFRDPRASPWMDIVANVVVAAPAPETEEFFAMVRAFLLHHRRNGLLIWHLDQVALYCVWRMLSVYRSAPHVSAIQDAAGHVHWHLGNAYDHKLSLPRYTRYSND